MYFCSWKHSYSKSSDVLPSSLPPCLCFPSPKLQATLYEGFLVTEETSWEWIRWEWRQDTTAPSPRGRRQLKVRSLDLDSNSSPNSDSELSDLGLAAELIRPQFPHLQNGLNTIQGPMIRQNFVACDVLLTFKVKVKGAQSCPTLFDPTEFSRNSVHGILQARILEWVAFPFSRGSSHSRDWAQVFHMAGEFFTSWATREAQEYGVGSLSLLQRIFLSQESNQDLLHCMWILYQLSYQGSQFE